MADWRVTRSDKDADGDITALCGTWGGTQGRTRKAQAIVEIKNGTHRYYVNVNGDEVDVIVAGSPPNEYLRTDPDKSPRNNLDNLPPC